MQVYPDAWTIIPQLYGNRLLLYVEFEKLTMRLFFEEVKSLRKSFNSLIFQHKGLCVVLDKESFVKTKICVLCNSPEGICDCDSMYFVPNIKFQEALSFF
jgi:hypothetical protein